MDLAPGEMRFGADAMDRYSMPLERFKTASGLGELIRMPVRDAPEKPGRKLQVLFDDRNPIIDGFTYRYGYQVTFTGAGNLAGNHFHLQKNELFRPAVGAVRVILQSRDEPVVREEIEMHHSDNSWLHVPAGIIHTVVAATDNAVLLVMADHPGLKSDEYPFELVASPS